VDTKICKRCSVEQNIEVFYKDKNGKRRPVCTKCRTEMSRILEQKKRSSIREVAQPKCCVVCNEVKPFIQFEMV